MSRPGENHDCDTCTAATLMNAVTTASSRATRRFPVMSWRETNALALRQAERTASSGRDAPRATMMAALYPLAGAPGTRAGQRPAPERAGTSGKRSWRLPRGTGRQASMATPFQVRPVTEGELPAFEYVDQHAFHGRPLAGVTGVYTFQMRVPGTMAAVAGVSMVAVLPSHRRRGVLSSLMRRQLGDIA